MGLTSQTHGAEADEGDSRRSAFRDRATAALLQLQGVVTEDRPSLETTFENTPRTQQ